MLVLDGRCPLVDHRNVREINSIMSAWTMVAFALRRPRVTIAAVHHSRKNHSDKLTHDSLFDFLTLTIFAHAKDNTFTYIVVADVSPKKKRPTRV